MRLPKNRLVRFALYAFSTAVILLAVDLLLIRLYARVHLGPDTTVLTAPTLPDGRINYVAAIDAPAAAGVTRENNALPLILRAIDVDRMIPRSVREPLLTSLGLPHDPDPTRLVDLEQFVKDQPGGRSKQPAPDWNPLTQHPWRAADHPVVADWLRHSGPALDRLHEASLRPRYFFPHTGFGRPGIDVAFAILLPDLNYARLTADVFLARAMLRAGSGNDPAGAVDDVLTAYRLAALYNQSPISISRTVANRMDEGASTTAAALAPHMPAEQLHALRDTLDRLPPLPPVIPTIDREERFLYLDALQYLSRFNPKRAVWVASTFAFPSYEHDDPALIARYCFPVDYDAHMRAVNHFFDRLVAALGQPDYPTRRAALDRWQASADDLPFLLRLRPFLPPNRIVGLRSSQNALDLATARRRLARVALDLASYKTDNGHYPPSLSDLPVDPTDPFTLKPLLYHPTPTGYALASAGPNMTDDGGRGDDLVASAP